MRSSCIRALPSREERVEVDAVRAVRLARKQILLDRARELPRSLTIFGRDDPVDHERAVQRKPVSRAAYDGEVVGAHGVVARPEEQRRDRGDTERRERPESRPPRAATEEEQRRENDQDLAHRPNEDEERERKPDRSGSPGRARLDQPGGEKRGEGEGCGVERVAREPVVEEDVPGIREHERRERDPHTGSTVLAVRHQQSTESA